jgi:hypothetical protein
MLEQGKQVGHAEESTESGAYVDEFDFAITAAGGDVESHQGAEAGTVHEGNLLKVEDDALFFGDQSANLVAELRSVLEGEFAVAGNNHGVVGAMGLQTEATGFDGHVGFLGGCAGEYSHVWCPRTACNWKRGERGGGKRELASKRSEA